MKTRPNQQSPGEEDLIISVLENSNGHKQLIESVQDELFVDLLKNVQFDDLFEHLHYSKVLRLSSYKEDMFLPFDYLNLIKTHTNGTCGYDAIGKGLGKELLPFYY